LTPATRNPAWNPVSVWAPSVILRDGVYYMFYTGVIDAYPCPPFPYPRWQQQIGVATSTDLYNWTQSASAWLSPPKAPWMLQVPEPYSVDFRDPFVTVDPRNGDWLAYWVGWPTTTAVANNIPSSTCTPVSWSQGMLVNLGRAPAGFTGAADWSGVNGVWSTNYMFSPGCNGINVEES